MKFKFTPGPWEVSAGDIWPKFGNPRVKIATTTKPSPMNLIDWQANARLLAEAPTLFAVTQLIGMACAHQANLLSTATQDERNHFINTIYDIWNDIAVPCLSRIEEPSND